jgi:hypothetical protein
VLLRLAERYEEMAATKDCRSLLRRQLSQENRCKQFRGQAAVGARLPHLPPRPELVGQWMEASVEAHRPHEKKTDFLKVTAALPLEVYKLISDEP